MLEDTYKDKGLVVITDPIKLQYEFVTPCIFKMTNGYDDFVLCVTTRMMEDIKLKKGDIIDVEGYIFGDLEYIIPVAIRRTGNKNIQEMGYNQEYLSHLDRISASSEQG